MSVQLVIELREKRGAQPVLQAIESYKTRLRAGIKRTRRRLTQFEQQYGVDTAHYQDANKALIFRYDNAAHSPPLPQAEHKHTPSGVEILPMPALAQVVDEILKETQP